MHYQLDLKNRPFNAIKACTKKVEGRVTTNWDQTPYDQMKPGDTITFVRESDKEMIKVKILYVRKYPDVRSMLEAECTKNVLSSGGDIEQGIASYHSIKGYRENILKHGIYAIGIKLSKP